MGEKGATERQPISVEDRLLTEVDHIMHLQAADGTIPEEVRAHMLTNLRTAVEEATLPYAITQTEHEAGYDQARQTRTFMWLGRSALDAAQTGYQFHTHKEARKRVDIEVDEALHSEQVLRPGVMKFFISPKMSRKDASYAEAQQEHLADDDAVRATWLETDHNGTATKRQLQSLLIRDVPLSAWVAMLEDPGNIFGKAISLRDKESALSVMEVHRELELPLGAVPHGPLSLIEAVVPYIADPATRRKVYEHIRLFYMEQAELQAHAAVVAERWLDFEQELATSLKTGRATPPVKSFVFSMQHHWDDEHRDIIRSHQRGDEFLVTRQLASIIEAGKRNILLGGMAVLSKDERATAGVDSAVLQQIHTNQLLIQMGYINQMEVQALEAQNARLIASVNIKPRGGCTVTGSAGFKNNDPSSSADGVGNELGVDKQNQQTEMERSSWKWKRGVCVVKSCATRPGTTMVGPCSVCKHCQHAFDMGKDPTKAKPTKGNKVAPVQKDQGGKQADEKVTMTSRNKEQKLSAIALEATVA